MQFNDIKLKPIEELIAIAEVTNETLKDAIAQWNENPPTPEAKGILEATDKTSKSNA